MKTIVLTLGLLLAGSHAVAQNKIDDHDSHHAAASSSEMTEAEVRKVDKSAKKITLKHGDIKNLDMAAMTMVFQVEDATLLDQVKTGDKVRFTADKINGAYVVLTIEPLKP